MRLLLLAALIAPICASAATTPQVEHSWLYGAWTVEHDEDGTPPDVMAFVPGKYVGYGVNCAYRMESPMHLNGGNVYVTFEVPNKGPIALIFRPVEKKSKLVFTSPRTRNNATYKRLDKNPCE